RARIPAVDLPASRLGASGLPDLRADARVARADRDLDRELVPDTRKRHDARVRVALHLRAVRVDMERKVVVATQPVVAIRTRVVGEKSHADATALVIVSEAAAEIHRAPLDVTFEVRVDIGVLRHREEDG